MNGWELPTSIIISEKEYEIRTDYRAVIDVLRALNDTDELFEAWMNESERNYVQVETMMVIMVPDYEQIPIEHWSEASKAISDFIDCGMREDKKKPKPQLMDWEQDAQILLPAINKNAKVDVRSLEYLHWWTFLGYYMEIGECLFGQVVSIRDKKKRGKKLEKWEREFYRDNKAMIDLNVKKIERPDEEKQELHELLGIKKR